MADKPHRPSLQVNDVDLSSPQFLWNPRISLQYNKCGETTIACFTVLQNSKRQL